MGAARYVAFLRAVNVGGRIVKMAELKKIFEAAGFADVSTFIASGNVLFSSPRPPSRLEPQIEAALHKALGFEVRTMVRSDAEVVAAAGYDAFSPGELAGGTLYVGFAQTPPAAPSVRQVLALQTAVDELRLHGREIYWLGRRGIADSTISMARIEKALQTPATFRNINTVRRLAAKFTA